MDQNTSRSPDLPQPLRAVASGLRHLPGAEQVGRVAGSALDTIGAVSPRGRRMAVYTGAGVLGVAGVVEWPVALTGAAVAWLTQPRPGPGAQSAEVTKVTEDTGGAEGTEPSGGTPVTAEGRQGPPARPAEEPGSESLADRGPGDRLTPTHHRNEPAEPPAHEQPARVGDTATASALKQVAEATTHHGQQPHGDRHTG
ncbi:MULTISPECIES: hypothetical protein [Streptomyces]|uniref:Uncharacterized protein n=1 Tax=Streptomyces viridosporus T7A TaxID=665577 RepID=A0ABX6AQ85_STRVD|nr:MULTISPECIES: hypothetical protein [Streptomyces]QEU89104.1 hypothetical protein CP969_05200 [Streptomyces viridosporus T7A]